MTIKQKTERGEGINPVDIKGKRFLGKQNNKYENPRQVLIGELEKQQGSHMSGVEGVRGKEV